MMCAVCTDDVEPALQIGAIWICPECGSTNIGAHKAVYEDIKALPESDIVTLRKKRAEIVRGMNR